MQTQWVWECGAHVLLTLTAVLGSGYFLIVQVRKPRLKMVKRLAQDHVTFKWQGPDLNPGLWNSKPWCMPACVGELAWAPAALPGSLQPTSGTSLLQGRALQRAA